MEEVSGFHVLSTQADGTPILQQSTGATCDAYLTYYQGRKCFQKMLKLVYQCNPRYVLAFQKEYELGSRLNHPHLVRYYAHDDTSIYIEYVDGLTLSDFLSMHPYYFRSRNHVRRFLHEVLETVDYLHKNQVLHLDLKPDNIMLTHIGRSVKIIDLGFSYSDAFDTTSGGTQAYSDAGLPERDERQDLFAVSKILEYIRQQCPKAAISYRLIQELATLETAEEYLQKKPFSPWRIGGIAAFCCLIISVLFFSVYHHQPKDPWEGLLMQQHPGSISPATAVEGVYIVDWTGQLVAPEEWNTGYRPIAVALITGNTRARIALNDLQEQVVWGSNTFADPLIHTNDSTLGHDTPGNALTDYQGAYNTMVHLRSNQPIPSAVSGASQYRFPDEKEGYLPALGELFDMKNHLSLVNAALEKCGGNQISTTQSRYWSSTQDYTYYRAWSLDMNDPLTIGFFADLRSENSPYADTYGAPKLSVRPFGRLE